MKRQVYLHRAEGQALVLVALVLVVLVGLVGLGLDGANAFAQRRNANIAADAAAMAGARTLLDMNRTSGKNKDVYKAIDEYLTTHLPSDGIISPYTFTAIYVDNKNNPAGAITAADNNSVPAVDPTDPASVRGISVDLHYSFKTFFMPLLGQDRLNVQSYGLAFVGPLGGTSGADLVPLAINRVQASDWFINHRSETWKIAMFGDDPTDSSINIRPANLRQITLKPGGPTPAIDGGISDCDSFPAAPRDNLTYWWCRGSPYRLATDERPANVAAPLSSSLKQAVNWRIDTAARSTVLFPIYEREVQPDATIKYNIRGFLAVKLKKWKNTSIPGLQVVEGEIVNYMTEPGPINGNTNGFFGTYAANLVQ